MLEWSFLVYLVRLIFLSFFLGWLFTEQVFIVIRRRYRFLLGFVSAPLAICLFEYVVGLVWIGVPIYILKISSVFLPAIYLMVRHKSFTQFVVKSVGYLQKMFMQITLKKNLRLALLILACIYILVGLIDHAVYFINTDVYGSDECHYLLEARYFVEDRNSYVIDSYNDERAYTIKSDDHGPLWVVLLSDALMFGESEDRNPTSLHFLYVLLGVYMLLALYIVASIFIDYKAGIFAIIIALNYKYMLEFPFKGSRDGFRYVAFFLLLAFLYDIRTRFINNEDEKLLRGRDYFYIVIFSWLCMNGHGGNAYLIVCILCAFVFWIMLSRNIFAKWRICIGVCIASIIGMCASLVKNVFYYLSTGNFRMYTEVVYEGTLAKVMMRDSKKQVLGLHFYDRYLNFIKDVSMGECIILIMTLAVIVMVSIIVIKSQCKEYSFCAKRYVITDILILFLALVIPITGLLDFIAGDVSRWFLIQKRYRMYLYLLCALVSGVCLSFIIDYCKEVAWLLYIYATIAILGVIYNINTYYANLESICGMDRSEFYKQCANVIDAHMELGDECLCNDQRIIYYMNKPAFFTKSIYMSDLYIAEGTTIEKEIEKYNLSLFAYASYESCFHEYLPYYEYINGLENIERRMEVGEWLESVEIIRLLNNK